MSILLAAVLGVPLVMALGLFLILRLGNEPERESAEMEEQ